MSDSDTLRGIVMHFRWPEPMDEHFLTHRRSATTCSTTIYLNHAIYPEQWQPSNLELRFWARGGCQPPTSQNLWTDSDRGRGRGVV